MTSIDMSHPHHLAREEVEQRGEDDPRDDGDPQRIERMFHRLPSQGERGKPAAARIIANVARPAARKSPRFPQNNSMTDPHPYSRLTPDVVLNSLDGVGLRCDGRLLALNSYENRVYQVGVE